MKRVYYLAAGIVLCIGAEAAYAQAPTGPVTPPNPFARPAYSPYLNLGRRGDPGFNYYGLVRPQQEFRAEYQQLQFQSAALQQNVTGLDSTINSVPVTGQRSGFMTHLRYFNNTPYGPTTGAARSPVAAALTTYSRQPAPRR